MIRRLLARASLSSIARSVLDVRLTELIVSAASRLHDGSLLARVNAENDYILKQ